MQVELNCVYGITGCDANPIELSWNTFKYEVKRRNVRQNLDEVEAVAKEVLSKIKGPEWKKYVEHVRKYVKV